jgi:hypothetical protein
MWTHMQGTKRLSHTYKQVNAQKHLLLWEPLRILSNSAPKIWSSVIWLKGVESSKGFQSAISADSDLPPAVPALDSSPCSKETNRILTSHRQNVTHKRVTILMVLTWIFLHLKWPWHLSMSHSKFHDSMFLKQNCSFTDRRIKYLYLVTTFMMPFMYYLLEHKAQKGKSNFNLLHKAWWKVVPLVCTM